MKETFTQNLENIEVLMIQTESELITSGPSDDTVNFLKQFARTSYVANVQTTDLCVLFMN